MVSATLYKGVPVMGEGEGKMFAGGYYTGTESSC